MIKNQIRKRTQMLAQTHLFNFPQQTVDNTNIQDGGIQTCQITILIHIIIVTLITWNVVLSIHIRFWTFSFFLWNMSNKEIAL